MDKHKGIILIVEDNLVMREGLQEILSLDGYQAVGAAEGEEALRLMNDITPDLILSDISMPGIDGYEFYERVHQREDWLTIPFIFLTARGERSDMFFGKKLGAEDYLVKPITRDELLIAIRSRLARSEQLRIAQLHQAYEASLTVLANAIDIRDPYTRGHVERVTAYSHEIAVIIGYHGRKLEHIRFGAILHDIGKIIIQESTLLKPGPLNEQEWLEIKKHPITGSEMIKDIPYLASAMPIIRHHHERWDGSGYPDQLAGETIPLGARIVAIADGYDAMTINRPYRNGLSLEQALKEINHCRGSQFDPNLVDVFHSAWKEKKFLPIWENWSFQNENSTFKQS